MNALRVVVDGRPLVGQRSGIGVHTAEIAARLAVQPPPLIASHAPIEDRRGIEHCRFQLDPVPFGVLWQQAVLPRLEGEVLWGPHGTLPLRRGQPAVVTLHDFTTLTMPHRHRLKVILSFNLFIGASLERATRIAAVSRAVAEQVMRGFGVPAGKIEIVPNGVDPFFSPGGEEEDYILFAGTLEPRKGIAALVDAWRALPAPRPRLILCGAEGWGTAVPDDPHIERTGYVSRERLRDLYRRSLLFVYPSREEGFGIPPLEAMACGAAVIATRTGAIADYAGDAALLIAPGDRAGLLAGMLRLLRDPALRRELRARAPRQVAGWTWDRSAAAMTSLLLEAVR